jgi:hypothetical protein
MSDVFDRFIHEERQMLAQLSRQPGWIVLVEKYLLPRIQEATQMLDRPAIDQQGHGDFLRGEKRAYMALVDVVYRAAGRKSPFQEHGLALLRTLEIEMPMAEAPEHQDTTGNATRQYPKGFPV